MKLKKNIAYQMLILSKILKRARGTGGSVLFFLKSLCNATNVWKTQGFYVVEYAMKHMYIIWIWNRRCLLDTSTKTQTNKQCSYGKLHMTINWALTLQINKLQIGIFKRANIFFTCCCEDLRRTLCNCEVTIFWSLIV